MAYSIIIPIHNEENQIPILLEILKSYSTSNEIIIIDDGSSDNSQILLNNCSFITVVKHTHKMGKGKAILSGIEQSFNEKIILFDGDMELNPLDLKSVMILNKNENIDGVFASRINNLSPLNTLFDFGNFFLNGLFNLINQTEFSDVLCGCKAFYKSDLSMSLPTAVGFDIDVEIASILVKKKCNINEVPISYTRRTYADGKKLSIMDGWTVLKRIIFSS